VIPLERLSLRDGAARSLRQQIVSGALRSGSLYSIGDIAQQLGTSPTPIREALLELENDGLVELVRNRGFRIRAISTRTSRDPRYPRDAGSARH
jgi:DNA-binding GntR family transcriptional regulator